MSFLRKSSVSLRTPTMDPVSSCERFVEWVDHVGYESHDPYDLWGTPYGLSARRKYYQGSATGLAMILPVVLIDLFVPSVRRFWVEKSRFATADAQLILGFLNLYEITGDTSYLERAIALGGELLAYSIGGFHGPCWGYPFDWCINGDEIWIRNTPYITCTPYCYEAFLALGSATSDKRYEEIAFGISEFVYFDLRDFPTGPDSSAASYSPFDCRRVVNASAYRAYVLIDAGRRFYRDDFLVSGRRNLNFVIESQQDDGSWYYAMEGKPSFIDNFHTCFNLKNLFKVNRLEPSDQVCEAIRNGYRYYREMLIDQDGYPRPFAVEPRLRISKFEMYDFAEGITLGSLLGKDIPTAADLARFLASTLIREYQLPSGRFVTREYRGGIRHQYPFIRWPQAQLFLALSNLACSELNGFG